MILPDAAWLSGYTGKIAADLTMRLLIAAGTRVARLFQDEPHTRALQQALSEGLTKAVGRLPLTSEYRDHYLELFQAFMKREAVIEELSQVIDPRPGASLNMDLLRSEFADAGFDPDTIAFQDVISAFVAAFYDAAAKNRELQGAIKIGLLRKIAENSRAQLALLERQAKAAESSAAHGSELVRLIKQLLRGQTKIGEVIEAVRRAMETPQPGQNVDIYQQLAAGLWTQGGYITLDAGGHPSINAAGPDIKPAIDFSPLVDVLEILRRAIDRPAEQLSAEELAAREVRYRELVKASYCNLRLEGLSTGLKPIVLPLEDVYVHLRAVSQLPEGADVFSPEERSVLRAMEEGGREADVREAQLRLDALRRERWAKERVERFPIADALRDPQKRGLVILGDPGSGKTTLLQFLALMFARGPEDVARHLQLTGPDRGRLPIFVPLAAYDEMLGEAPELTIREFLGRYYDRRRAAPGLDPIFQAALEAGGALVLLDGLDEVVEESRRKYVAEQVSAFIREAMLRGNRVLLTSRIYGYRAAPLSIDLPHVTVLDFRREVEIFARQWSRAMAAWDAQTELVAQEEERRLLKELRSNPGVERLAANPLLLTMLALLYRQVGGLPQRRIQLYDLYVRALIQNWEENRSRGARLSAPKHTDTLEAETVLIPLSLWLQQNRASGTATREELMAQLVAIYLAEAGEDPDAKDVPAATLHAAQRRAEIFLADMRQFSGVLVERGQNAFGFRHLTFQEYFAGRALARMQPEKRWALLWPNLHASRWREPILLAAARLGVTENRSAEVTDLVEQILGAGSDYEAILHRDLFLACDCAADDIGVDLRVLRGLVQELVPLAASHVRTMASRAIDLLSRLGLLRAGDVIRLPEALDALAGIVDAAGIWSIGMLRPLSRVWVEPGRLHESTKMLVLRMASGFYFSDEADAEIGSFVRQSDDLREALVERLEGIEDIVHAGAIGALTSLVGQDPSVRAAVISKLQDPSPIVRMRAVRALGGVAAKDPAVRAAVAARLNDAQTNVRQWTMGALRGLLAQDTELCLAVTGKLDDGDPDTRAAAIRALAELVGGDPAVRKHVKARLGDPEPGVRAAALDALAGLLDQDTEVLTAAMAALNDTDSELRRTATRVLAGMAYPSAEVLRAVVSTLQDIDGTVRAQAIAGLSRFAGKDSTITAAMCALFSHPDWVTRRQTLSALTPGVRGHGAVRELIGNEMGNLQCLESAGARAGAIRALGKLAGDGAIAARISARLNHPEPRLRSAAVEALARLVDRDASVRSAVVAKLDDTDGSVRAAGVRAVAGIASQDTLIRSRVTGALDDPDGAVRAAALDVLAGLSSHDEAIRRAIIEKLEDRNAGVRLAAVEGVKLWVQEDPAARATIISRTGDQDGRVRGAAILALAGLIDRDAEARAAVIGRLGDPSVREEAAAALAGLVVQDAAVRTEIFAKTGEPDVTLRAGAIRAMAELATLDPVVRDAILAKLKDPEPILRRAAIETLEGVASGDERVRTALVGRLNDSCYGVRRATVRALGVLTGEEPQVRAAVLAIVQDEDGDVRAAAVRQLGGLMSQYPAVRSAIVSKLDDPDSRVRAAAVDAICRNPLEDEVLYRRLLPVLGSEDNDGSRQAAVRLFSRLAATNPAVRAEMVQLLRAEDWRTRLSAVEVLAGANTDALREIVPELVEVLDDFRGLDSWPARIAAAEFLLNDYQWSEKAIQTILPALDYGTHPLVFVLLSGEVRRRAAVALGTLNAERRDPAVLPRVVRLMAEEEGPHLLDGAYNALLSLVAAPER